MEDVQRSFFLINVTGEIECGTFPGITDLYCKYCYVWGSDWAVVAGTEEGWSQTAKKALDGEEDFVWNLPFDITFRSTNPQGWPQIVLSTYGLDYWGRDVVRGYGSIHLPVTPGRCVKRIAMFVPESASLLQRFGSWLTGTRPEYVDPRVVAGGDGREVTRVRTQGVATVKFNTMLKDFSEMGYVGERGEQVQAAVPKAFRNLKPVDKPDTDKSSVASVSVRGDTPLESMSTEKTRPKPERRRKKSAPIADTLGNVSRQTMEIESIPGDE